MLPFKAQTVRAQRQELEDSRPLRTNSLLDLIKCFIQVDIALRRLHSCTPSLLKSGTGLKKDLHS